MTYKAGYEAVEERRRAVVSKKQGELWKVGEGRMKSQVGEEMCGKDESCGEKESCGELWQKREQESYGKEERTKAVVRRRR